MGGDTVMKILSKYSEQGEKIYDYTLTIEDYYILSVWNVADLVCMCLCARKLMNDFSNETISQVLSHIKRNGWVIRI